MTQPNGRPARLMRLTERERRFAEAYVAGPTAGNATASVRAAGYRLKDDNTAGSWGSQLLKKPRVLAYLIELRRAQVARAAEELVPWRRLLPAAQALQMEAIETARQALAELGVRDPATGKLVLDLGKVTGPIVGLLKAGLEASETVEAYGIGRPIMRSEIGEPGEFAERDLEQQVAEIREHLAFLQAAGIDLLPVDVPRLAPPSPERDDGQDPGTNDGQEDGP